MLVRTGALPDYVIVDAQRMLPRFWATAWSLSLQARAPSENTRKMRLRHVDAFYVFTDHRFGLDAFDEAMSTRDAEGVRDMVDAFFIDLTAEPDYNTTAVQRWDSVRGFVQHLARQLAPSSFEWSSLSSTLYAMGRMRRPAHGRFTFIRALPAATLIDLLKIAHFDASRNPFKGESLRARNWLIVNLLLMVGLRRGELLLLTCDAMKSDVDIESGELIHWLDITTAYDSDPRATRPSMKTAHSHRQVPVSAELAALFEWYVSEHRARDPDHGLLITARSGAPLSAESVTKIFDKLSRALGTEPRRTFFERSGGKESISPHDLRHTCATARWSMFMAHDGDRDLTLQRMRAFFGWSIKSDMPEHYARAAVQEDLLRTWSRLFDSRVSLLRGIPT